MNILSASLKSVAHIAQTISEAKYGLAFVFANAVFTALFFASCVTTSNDELSDTKDVFGQTVKTHGDLLTTRIDAELPQLITVDRQGVVRNWKSPLASKPNKQSKLPFLATTAWDVGDSQNRILLFSKDKSGRSTAFWLDKLTHRYKAVDVPKELFQATGALLTTDSKSWFMVNKAGFVSVVSRDKPSGSNQNSEELALGNFQISGYQPCQIPSNQLAFSDDGLVLFACNAQKLEFYSLPSGIRINTADQLTANITSMIYLRMKASSSALVLFDDQTFFNSNFTESDRLLSMVAREDKESIDDETLIDIMSTTNTESSETVDVKVRRGVSNSDLLDSLSCKRTANGDHLVTVVCEGDDSIMTQFDIRNGFGTLSLKTELYQCSRTKELSSRILTRCVPI